MSYELTSYLSDFHFFFNFWKKVRKARKLSFTNIRGLCSNTVGCESFLKSCSTYIIVLYKTNSNDSINSSNITVTGHIPLIWKNSVTHIHNLAVYVGTVIRKVQDFLFIFYEWLYLICCFTFFSIDHRLRFCTRLFMLYHLT